MCRLCPPCTPQPSGIGRLLHGQLCAVPDAEFAFHRRRLVVDSPFFSQGERPAFADDSLFGQRLCQQQVVQGTTLFFFIENVRLPLRGAFFYRTQRLRPYSMCWTGCEETGIPRLCMTVSEIKIINKKDHNNENHHIAAVGTHPVVCHGRYTHTTIITQRQGD